jgi:hypothetical protein
MQIKFRKFQVPILNFERAPLKVHIIIKEGEREREREREG